MIIQGSNTPIVVTFSDDIATMVSLVATLWTEDGQNIKTWNKDDMIPDNDGTTVELPLTEEETREYPVGFVSLEIKGVAENGQILFWKDAKIRVQSRMDREIDLIN